MIGRKILLMFAAAGTLLCTTHAVAENPGLKYPKLMESRVPVPSALLIHSYRYMGKLKQFSIDAVTTSDEAYWDKMVVTYTHHIHIDMQRPGKLHVWTSGDLKEKAYYLNSGKFTVYDALKNYYGTLEVPPTIDKALDYLFEIYGVQSPLANLLYSDLERRLAPKSKGFYFGKSEVDNVVCHHIGFVTPLQEFQLWIEAGKEPLIRKFIVIDKSKPYFPRSGTVIKWKLNPKFNEGLFIFEQPKGAVKLDIEPADAWEVES